MLYEGDALAVLRTLEAASVDAICTDPPAGINFMGQTFDSDRGGRQAWIAWLAEIMREALRVIKPGGHACVWALPRTSHWTATALEDAGWDIRDCVTHLFGQGFPKSLDVSKALDKAAGAKREALGNNPHYRSGRVSATTYMRGAASVESPILTAPATDLARQWDGWGTALKPAAEFWWLVRAPLSAPTVAANVARWSVGALNIDACRIPGPQPPDAPARANRIYSSQDTADASPERERYAMPPAGRWPPNVAISHTLFCESVGMRRVRAAGWRDSDLGWKSSGGLMNTTADRKAPRQNHHAAPDGTETVEAWFCAPDCPVFLLNQQSGERKSGGTGRDGVGSHVGLRGNHLRRAIHIDRVADTGGASRFFYCAKASPAERAAGLQDGERNGHPTVKPLALLRWLVRLVTPPGGTVLDPFMGSGSIGAAAVAEGFSYIGIEQHGPYVDTARQRIAYWAGQPEAVG